MAEHGKLLTAPKFGSVGQDFEDAEGLQVLNQSFGSFTKLVTGQDHARMSWLVWACNRWQWRAGQGTKGSGSVVVWRHCGTARQCLTYRMAGRVLVLLGEARREKLQKWHRQLTQTGS